MGLMMGIYDLIALAARNIQMRYLNLAGPLSDSSHQSLYTGQEPVNRPLTPLPVDQFLPSTPTQLPYLTGTDPLQTSTPVVPVDETADEVPVPADDALVPVEGEPEASAATYFFRRRAKLNYHLDLGFDMQAFSRTVEQLSEGNVQSVEQFSAAGFGLKAALDIKGKQFIETNLPAPEGALQTKGHIAHRSRMRSRQAMQIGIQGRDFAAQGFHRQSTSMMQSMKETYHNDYRRTVNKFAYRFRMDTSFNFSFLERFNAQTQDVTDQAPESLGNYVTSAGNVAEMGTPGMMAAFFDAVDGYLDRAEEQLVDKVNQFFDMAAEELGMSEAMIDTGREHLLGAIDSFFSQVDEALAGMESQFVTSELVQPTLPVGEPIVIPENYQDPAIAPEQTQVAMA